MARLNLPTWNIKDTRPVEERLAYSYITPRILIMSDIWTGRSNKQLYKNNIIDVDTFLTKYHENKFMIWTNALHNVYQASMWSHLGSQILSFPFDSPVNFPSVDVLLQIAYSIHFWLSSDSQNVAVLVIKNLNVEILTCIISTFFLVCDYKDSILDSFNCCIDKIAGIEESVEGREKNQTSFSSLSKRVQDLLQIIQKLHNQIPPPFPLELQRFLKTIVIRGFPLCDIDDVHEKPLIKIYQGRNLYPDVNSESLNWKPSTLTYSHDAGVYLKGDYLIECYSCSEECDRRVLFRYQSSTFYLKDGVLQVNKDALDIIDPDVYFTDFFSLELTFEASVKKSSSNSSGYMKKKAESHDTGLRIINQKHLLFGETEKYTKLVSLGIENVNKNLILFSLQRNKNDYGAAKYMLEKFKSRFIYNPKQNIEDLINRIPVKQEVEEVIEPMCTMLGDESSVCLPPAADSTSTIVPLSEDNDNEDNDSNNIEVDVSVCSNESSDAYLSNDENDFLCNSTEKGSHSKSIYDDDIVPDFCDSESTKKIKKEEDAEMERRRKEDEEQDEIRRKKINKILSPVIAATTNILSPKPLTSLIKNKLHSPVLYEKENTKPTLTGGGGCICSSRCEKTKAVVNLCSNCNSNSSHLSSSSATLRAIKSPRPQLQSQLVSPRPHNSHSKPPLCSPSPKQHSSPFSFLNNKENTRDRDNVKDRVIYKENLNQTTNETNKIGATNNDSAKKAHSGPSAIQNLLQDSFFNPGKNSSIVHKDIVNENEELIKLKDDPIYSKYFRLLLMRVPIQAVKAKMMQEGLDPIVLDFDVEKPLPRFFTGELKSNLKKTMEDINRIDITKIEGFRIKLSHHPIYKPYLDLVDAGLKDEALALMFEQCQGPTWILDCSRDQEFPFNVSSLRTKKKPKSHKIPISITNYVSTRVGTVWHEFAEKVKNNASDLIDEFEIQNICFSDGFTFRDYFLEKMELNKNANMSSSKLNVSEGPSLKNYVDDYPIFCKTITAAFSSLFRALATDSKKKNDKISENQFSDILKAIVIVNLDYFKDKKAAIEILMQIKLEVTKYAAKFPLDVKLTNFEHFSVFEKCFIYLCRVPRLEEKLSVINFFLNFKNDVCEIQDKIIPVIEACNDLINSHKFQEFLLITLQFIRQLGNGEVLYGFSLIDLERLLRTNSFACGSLGNSKNISLLDFVIEYLESSQPNIVSFHLDMFDNMKLASMVDIQGLDSLMDSFNNHANMIKKLTKDTKVADDFSEADPLKRLEIQKSINAALCFFDFTIDEKRKTLHKVHNEMKSRIRAVSERYGEFFIETDINKKDKYFFRVFRDFLVFYDSYIKGLENKRMVLFTRKKNQSMLQSLSTMKSMNVANMGTPSTKKTLVFE